MASVHRIETEGGEPRWKVRWRNRGESKNRAATCHTAAAAERVRLRADYLHDLGQPYYGPEAEAEVLAAQRVDLRAALRDYIAARRRAGKSAGTIYQTSVCVQLFFEGLAPEHADAREDEPPPPLWHLDDRGNQRLTSDALNAYYDRLLHQRGCSLETARGHVGYVQRWWKWLGNHDVYGDLLPRPRTIEMAEPPARADPVAPTWDEMDRAISAALGWYRRLMIVCRMTGLRGEDQVLQLRLDDVDFAARTVRIRPELGKTKAEKRGRVVPVSKHLLDLIPTWPVDPAGWLIHVEKLNEKRWPGPAKRRAWNDQVSGAWERAGIRREAWDTQPTDDGSRKNGRPLHAFRRGFITGLQVLGGEGRLSDIQRLVGHKAPLMEQQAPASVTTERYTDPAFVRKLRDLVDLIPPLNLVEIPRTREGAVSGDEHWSRRTPEKVRRGSANGSAVLDEDRVRELLLRWDGGRGETIAALARAFEVTPPTIRSIVTGKRWAHVAVPGSFPAKASDAG